MAAVVSVEWKATLKVANGQLQMDKSGREAVDGAIRDAEHVLGTALPLSSARRSFITCVIGDGVLYALLLLSKRPTGDYDVRMSRAYEFARPKDGKVEAERDDAFAFFKLCVHTLQVSASGLWTYECGWTTDRWPAGVIVSEVLAGDDTVVFRFVDAAGGTKIGKAAGNKVGVERLALEIEQRQHVAQIAAEREQPIDVTRIFVPATVQLLAGHQALVFDDVGFVSLEALVYKLSLAELPRLAALVWRDINAGLAQLHLLDLAFGDVHVGNILISADQKRAVLVDCESICAFGTVLRNILVRPLFRPIAENAVASEESDLESLRYCIAWTLDINNFRTRMVARHSQSAPLWVAAKRSPPFREFQQFPRELQSIEQAIG
jgi:hypothetical protein